jgi:hypothetical protein
MRSKEGRSAAATVDVSARTPGLHAQAMQTSVNNRPPGLVDKSAVTTVLSMTLKNRSPSDGELASRRRR